MRLALLFIVVVLSVVSCKKSEPISPGLFGKWELRRKYGGFAGIDSTYKAGNGYIIRFNSDSTYTHYVKWKPVNTGTFRIRFLNIPDAGRMTEIYFGNTDFGSGLMLNGAKMTIGEDFDDGIATEYEKMGN